MCLADLLQGGTALYLITRPYRTCVIRSALQRSSDSSLDWTPTEVLAAQTQTVPLLVSARSRSLPGRESHLAGMYYGLAYSRRCARPDTDLIPRRSLRPVFSSTWMQRVALWSVRPCSACLLVIIGTFLPTPLFAYLDHFSSCTTRRCDAPHPIAAHRRRTEYGYSYARGQGGTRG